MSNVTDSHQEPVTLTQAEIDSLVQEKDREAYLTPVSIEDVYTLMVQIHAGQQAMSMQLNALVNVVNQVAAQVPAAMEAIESSPFGSLLKRFLPRADA